MSTEIERKERNTREEGTNEGKSIHIRSYLVTW